jgi:hypothetical protein
MFHVKRQSQHLNDSVDVNVLYDGKTVKLIATANGLSFLGAVHRSVLGSLNHNV